MLTSPDSSMIEDLTIDELRWLEASEILDFPTSPTDTYHLNDRVVLSQRISRFSEDPHRPEAHLKNTSRIITPPSSSSSPTRDARPSKRSTSASQSLPTPPRTPPRRASPPQLNVQGSPSEWLYRRPKTPNSSRVTPSASALSSTLTLNPPLTFRTQEVHDKFEKPASAVKASENAPFWASMLRPRSRSVRSIPGLKTIPSQSQVDIHDPMPPPLDDRGDTITMSRRSPSISSTSSSTLSSVNSSLHPETPVSAHPDPFGGVFANLNKGYHRRHVSQSSPQGYMLPPLSSSCPSKSILTRASSISTKDSAATANKSVKFVEVPTVHYASAGYWDVETVNRGPGVHYSHLEAMGVDVDEMDMGDDVTPTQWGGADDTAEYQDFTLKDDMKNTTPPGRGLKRLMTLSRRSSVSTTGAPSVASSSSSPASALSLSLSLPQRRKSSASTISTSTITPNTSKSLPPIPQNKPSAISHNKSSISGPYALGSHPLPASPAQSTASLRSTTHRHKAKAKSTSSAVPPLPSIPASGVYNNLEACRSTKNSAARSVRSLVSVKSEAGSTAPRFKSWLNRVGL